MLTFLSVDNGHFYVHNNSIYPSKLEIKDITESFTFTVYFNVLLNAYALNKLTKSFVTYRITSSPPSSTPSIYVGISMIIWCL
jgi:hypothetical protein